MMKTKGTAFRLIELWIRNEDRGSQKQKNQCEGPDLMSKFHAVVKMLAVKVLWK